MAPPTLILGIHLGDELALCIWRETPLSVQQVVLRMTKKSLLTSLSVTPEHPDSWLPASLCSWSGVSTFYLVCGESLAAQKLKPRRLGCAHSEAFHRHKTNFILTQPHSTPQESTWIVGWQDSERVHTSEFLEQKPVLLIQTRKSGREKGQWRRQGLCGAVCSRRQLCWAPCCVCAPFHFVYSSFHFLLRNYDTTPHFLYKFSLSTFCFWHTAQYVGRVLPANNQLFSWQKITCQQVTFKFQILIACQKRDVVFKILMGESSVSAHIDVNVKTKRTCFLPWWTELLEFLIDFNHKTE